ncbi:hypothetical protein [Hymenobacter swuensis]|uniref:Uncharacterized protein n=1 Tax=Hymenobacter swuensis DY53 TaxID=1227739 RepID=W8F542_9BACT|nr:hypothetical protein [Hymenobacter swuensis]AHJ99157.1 hypothetical protein Hsw_3562 [Hymenobacter swuensis DY53]
MSIFSNSALSIGLISSPLNLSTISVPVGPPPVPLPTRRRLTEQQAAARCRNHARSAPYYSGKRW